MVQLWGRVRSARIRSGQVGKGTCQGTHVIFEITEITPPSPIPTHGCDAKNVRR